jgi:hypothetical protein
MLKRLAILALVGAVATVSLLAAQTAPLSPPKQGVAEPSSGKNAPKQPDPQKTNPPTRAMPAPGQPSTPTCDEACQQGRENLAIQGKLEWFTGLLALVGFLQVGGMFWQALLLRQTRGDVHAQADWMKTQAGYMERQTKILEDSVAAAQKSADAALAQVEAAKSTQRAQFRIEFAEPDWTFNEELGGYSIHFRVIMDGATRAYVLDDSIIAYIDEKPREGIGAWKVMGVQRDFTPELSPFVGYTLLQTSGRWPENETSPEKPKLASQRKLTLFVNGRIWYRDIFRDEWMLEIDRYWHPWSSYGDENATGGMWSPVGSGRHDTHRKVDSSYRDQPLKPN